LILWYYKSLIGIKELPPILIVYLGLDDMRQVEISSYR